jgi:translation initiation factor 1
MDLSVQIRVICGKTTEYFFMNKKNKPDIRGFVYSTDPNFQFEGSNENAETLLPEQQKLRIRLETKHRAGKAVTLITGFIGTNEDLEELGKKLKSFCGTGGSAKVGEIIIQGDQRDKVLQWLLKNDYTSSKKI